MSLICRYTCQGQSLASSELGIGNCLLIEFYKAYKMASSIKKWPGLVECIQFEILIRPLVSLSLSQSIDR